MSYFAGGGIPGDSDDVTRGFDRVDREHGGVEGSHERVADEARASLHCWRTRVSHKLPSLQDFSQCIQCTGLFLQSRARPCQFHWRKQTRTLSGEYSQQEQTAGRVCVPASSRSAAVGFAKVGERVILFIFSRYCFVKLIYSYKCKMYNRSTQPSFLVSLRKK